MFDPSRNWKSALIGAITFTIVLWSAVNIPGLSLSAQFSPTKPRLGETVVVNVTASPGKITTPTVQGYEKM